MRKSRIMFILILSFSMKAAFADFQQNIQLCLDIYTNTSNKSFVASFVSSDLFDSGTQTGSFYSGTRCVNHVYTHGPKNVRFTLRLPDIIKAKDTSVLKDQSCNFMHQEFPFSLKSNYIRLEGKNETWSISLVQHYPTSGYKDVYLMSCHRIIH